MLKCHIKIYNFGCINKVQVSLFEKMPTHSNLWRCLVENRNFKNLNYRMCHKSLTLLDKSMDTKLCREGIFTRSEDFVCFGWFKVNWLAVLREQNISQVSRLTILDWSSSQEFCNIHVKRKSLNNKWSISFLTILFKKFMPVQTFSNDFDQKLKIK